MKNKLKILGIDPGLAITGFALIEESTILDFGVIITDKKIALPERLSEISDEFEQIIQKHKPDKIAVEKLVFVQNVTSGIAVAHARGVILAIGAKYKIPILEIFPKDVKLRICGFGNAPKIQVQRMVQKVFKLTKIPKPDDAADALAVAYAAI